MNSKIKNVVLIKGNFCKMYERDFFLHAFSEIFHKKMLEYLEMF